MKTLHFILLCNLFTFTSCTSLFFQGDPYLYQHPKKLNIPFKEVSLKSGTETLIGWHLYPKDRTKSKGLILFFHGNAQNISAHFLNIAWITKMNYEVFIFDYRGYGKSSGEAEFEGINKDALVAMEYTEAHAVKNKIPKLIFYGQSLGGNILMRAMEDFHHTKNLDLLVLDSTFNSYQDMAFDKLKGFWPTFLLSPLAYILVSDSMAPTKFESLTKYPLLIIHSKTDQVVPFKFGEYIQQKTSGKDFWILPEARHIDVFYTEKEKYRKIFLDFLNK
jgi:alpha-beta hydrolase superfamily lysophospholipase